jgi:hypothetical protein
VATSTDETVREKIVAAIQGVAGELGFDDVGGNVQEYPLEFHQAESPASYLSALVGGKQEPRAWAVDVGSFDEWKTTENGLVRTYLIRVLAYYVDVPKGANYLLMKNHASKVRGAITALDSNLGGVVSMVTRGTQMGIKKVPGVASLKLLMGEMNWTALKINPDF